LKKWFLWEKVLIILIIFTLLFSITAGCGSDNPKEEATGSSSLNQKQNLATSDAGDGIVRLNYWTIFTGPDGKIMYNIVQEYNKQYHEQVEVKLSVWSEDEYYNKLIPAVASGTAPEIGIIHISRLSKYAVKGILQPLDDLAIKMGLSEKDFPLYLWKAGIIDGKRYTIPLDIHPLGLYYNVDLLNKAGFSKPPENLEEFLKMAKACTRDLDGDGKPDQWGFATAKMMISRIYWSLLHQYGGRAVAEDGSSPAYDSPEGIQALRFLSDLTYKYKIAPVIFNPDGEFTLFEQKKLAFHINGIWVLSELRTKKDLNFEIAPIPMFGKKKAVWGDSHNFVFFKQRKKDLGEIDAAGKFVSYLLDHSLEWAKAGQVPARTKIRNSYEFNQLRDQVAFARQEDYISVSTMTANYNAIWSPITDEITNALLGRDTPENALKKAAKKAKENIAANK
jgi:multiple sugar transport system substrate-binding protein